MILTVTHTVEGFQIAEYKGIIVGEMIPAAASAAAGRLEERADD